MTAAHSIDEAAATPTPEEIVETLAARRKDRLTRLWTTYGPRNPIASDLPDCRRYLVMRQIAWQVKPPPDPDGLEVIENGRVQEPAMIHQLQDEGFDVVELQAPFEIRRPLVADGPLRLIMRGNMDGKLRLERRFLVPFDTKDTSEHVVESVNTEEDLAASPWTRKWRRQVQMYARAAEAPFGLLILGHRGHRKVVPVQHDQAFTDELLERAAWAVGVCDDLEGQGVTHETVDAALLERGVPYHSDFRECKRCPFFKRACFPADPAPGQAKLRPDLAADIGRYLEIKPLASEAEKLRKRIRDETEGVDSTIAGPFVVEGEWKTRKMPAQAARVDRFWSPDIRATGGSGSEGGAS